MNFDKSINIEVFGELVEGMNDIAQSWMTILHTIPGSDPLRATFGSGIYNYVDKPVTQFEGDFASMVIRDLERWEKRATISRVTRIMKEGAVAVEIYGTYTATNTPIQITVDLNDLKNENLSELQRAYSEAYQEEAYN